MEQAGNPRALAVDAGITTVFSRTPVFDSILAHVLSTDGHVLRWTAMPSCDWHWWCYGRTRSALWVAHCRNDALATADTAPLTLVDAVTPCHGAWQRLEVRALAVDAGITTVFSRTPVFASILAHVLSTDGHVLRWTATPGRDWYWWCYGRSRGSLLPKRRAGNRRHCAADFGGRCHTLLRSLATI
jgi:hypothetical protein